ncbi:tyrosine-protein phosphatase [Pontibacter cellulosilyticus]|uniref:protein-tyrosine-phosphatase n=1 Tax=Pontibacter cellulosilyticus TaxID=1720253 RepID=A0A923N6U6_9BACT|nr:CpsB/CapC family capsule biosynthesis tyrosine phosphatase [Pontibacter cellulosilyticus]MBC5992864.1 capsular biosynthesis protein [Pontibacter cellulosilyticus]
MKKFLQSLFKGESVAEASFSALAVDMHSHILPGLDDGADSLEKSLELVQAMKELGYRKLIMTPHIMSDFYKNTPDMIRERLAVLRAAVQEAGIDMELDCAAEHYLDEGFLEKLSRDEELLTFGDNYLLFETSFLNEPLNLREAIFKMRSKGYKPVLAHPERYSYFYGKFDDLAELWKQGVLFQPNLNSLSGYYSPAAKTVAEKLIDSGMVDFLGSDVHSLKHTDSLNRVLASKYLPKALSLAVRNSQL